MASCVILKVGGSLLTDKGASPPRLRKSQVETIGQKLYHIHQKGEISLLIVHGAGSFGHLLAKKFQLAEGLSSDPHKASQQILALAKTQRLLYELSCQILEIWQEIGLPCFPIQVSAFTHSQKGQALFPTPPPPLQGLLRSGCIPVCYGVPVWDSCQGCAILSGDHIAPWLARSFSASRLIHLTERGGVFAGSSLISRITPANWEAVLPHLKSSDHPDVTGGMRTKVEEAYRLACETGIPVTIGSPDQLEELIQGRGGTQILGFSASV